jgi:Domain of unknown function (DUF4279)
MEHHDDRDMKDGLRRRFDVELFIVHPTMDPIEISTALGLEGSIVHRVGDRKTTPDGLPLVGSYPDTRWRHSVRYEVRDQFFAPKVKDLVDRLAPHREFIRGIRTTGGKAVLIVQFLGDAYFGDEIAADTLAKMADLQLDCGVECFATPQGRPTRDREPNRARRPAEAGRDPDLRQSP